MLKMVILKEPENSNRRKTKASADVPHDVEMKESEEKDISEQQ